jgi:hypothetical protein
MIKKTSTPRILQLYAGFNRIAAMLTEPNIKRHMEYSLVRTQTTVPTFAKPGEIQQAIDDGRTAAAITCSKKTCRQATAGCL